MCLCLQRILYLFGSHNTYNSQWKLSPVHRFSFQTCRTAGLTTTSDALYCPLFLRIGSMYGIFLPTFTIKSTKRRRIYYTWILSDCITALDVGIPLFNKVTSNGTRLVTSIASNVQVRFSEPTMKPHVINHIRRHDYSHSSERARECKRRFGFFYNVRTHPF